MKELLQQENALTKNILDFLKFFSGIRKMTWRQIGEGTGYEATTLTKVFNGHQEGGEKLLHALESFYQLDNLKRISQIELDIEGLKREKAILQQQTVARFYAERAMRTPDGVEVLEAVGNVWRLRQ